MSFTHNVREEYETNVFTGKKKEAKNAYFQGNLNEENKQRIEEFDFAVEQLENILEDLEIVDADNLDIDEEYHLAKVLTCEKTRNAIKDFILTRMEYARNDYVVSMIDSQVGEKG